MAQSMSETQILEFVQKEQQKGTSQQVIVSKLVKKGVTPDQLRKLKQKYEAQGTQPGAVNLTGPASSSGANRSRTAKEKAEDALRSKNNYMIRSQRAENERVNSKTMEQQMNEGIGFLDIDSVLYYQNMFKEPTKVFGRDIFSNEMLTFEPSMNIPTPATYVLGAGDQVIIDVWGESQETFDQMISPDGVVVIEGIGPLRLSGMTVNEANTYVKRKIGPYYEGSDVSLTVGETRTIQVQVVGEVVMPGSYTMSAFATSFNALYAAGGISDVGTLRNIKVYRAGREMTTIDVYDYLFNGNTSGDIRLEDNDVIVVGAYNSIVDIQGKVKRPMMYEMKEEESVARLLDYAGGFAGDAFRENVRLTRKSGREYTIRTVGEFEMASVMLKDGDSLYVDSVIPRYANMAEVRGAVFHPGMFQMDGSITTVRALLKAAGGLREDAFVNRAVMHREKEDLTMEVMSVDIEGILGGEVADIPLRKGDVLYVPSRLEMQKDQTLTIRGEVNYPGTYQFAHNMTIEDFVLQAGGLTEAASMARVDIFRRVKDPNAVTDNEQIAETFSLSLREGFVIEPEKRDFVLQPFDEVYVRKSPGYSEQQNVKVSGAVNFEGEYSMTSKSYRLSDLIKAAGGLSSIAYAKGARLQRQLTEEEKMQRENAFRNSQIQMYEESLQSEKSMNMAHADSIMTLKLDLGNTYLVAIDLEAAVKKPGSLQDVILRDGDELTIPQYSSTVKISGEVMSPITINYDSGKGLKYYLKRAGGSTNRAQRSKTYVVYMNGAVKELGRRCWAKNIEPGCEIVVPASPLKSGMSTAEILTIGTSTASVATMIVTMVNILKK